MRNRHVVLYDLNCPSKYITPNDLGGCLEVAMASEAVGSNVHMDTRVVKVADFKSEAK